MTRSSKSPVLFNLSAINEPLKVSKPNFAIVTQWCFRNISPQSWMNYNLEYLSKNTPNHRWNNRNTNEFRILWYFSIIIVWYWFLNIIFIAETQLVFGMFYIYMHGSTSYCKQTQINLKFNKTGLQSQTKSTWTLLKWLKFRSVNYLYACTLVFPAPLLRCCFNRHPS